MISLFLIIVSGAIAALLALRFAKKIAKNSSSITFETADAVRNKALHQKELILEEARSTAREQFESKAARLEEERQSQEWVHTDYQLVLDAKQSELDKKNNELQLGEQTLAEKELSIQEARAQAVQIQSDENETIEKLQVDLAIKGSVQKEEAFSQLREEILSVEQLGISRWLIENGENLKNESQKFGRDVLSNVMARYCPTFVWPKGSFSVQTPNKSIIERFFGDGSEVVSLLTLNTDTSIEVLVEENSTPTIKLAGGLGVDKEVLRLTLEEAVGRNNFSLNYLKDILAKHRRNIDNLILRMGQAALKELDLAPMHPEILKLIGSLNYRTSHRQNQYHHTVEVARLAGMLADEVGVDRALAKRSGLLHDIGKVLDYKIEGSHAVISGDYAARFGEKEDVVDTVLSHHNDKIVETAHAYILKAADALSGARPGARVDMEDGYQKRIESIAEVVKSFEGKGVLNSAIMHAGREIHVFVDNRKVKERDAEPLASDIAKKLETDVQFPGQIKVTVVRRTEVTAVA